MNDEQQQQQQKNRLVTLYFSHIVRSNFTMICKNFNDSFIAGYSIITLFIEQ